MDNPLEQPVPDDPIARVHAFARDLAWGVAHGLWGTGFRILIIGGMEQQWLSLSAGEAQTNLHNLRVGKWKEKFPESNLLQSFEYLVPNFAEQPVDSRPAYLLTPKALALLEKPPRPPQVFISYRQNESSPFALLIEARLTLRDPTIGIFIDKLIEGGAKWLKRIEQEVRQCDTFIIIYGPDTPNSTTIPLEIEWAEESGSTIIPVLHHEFTRCCEGYPEQFKALNDITVEKESVKAYESAITDILIALGYSTLQSPRTSDTTN